MIKRAENENFEAIVNYLDKGEASIPLSCLTSKNMALKKIFRIFGSTTMAVTVSLQYS